MPSRFNEAPAVRGGRFEDVEAGGLGDGASMRPPQFAGEDRPAFAAFDAVFLASMRPPQFAGEDVRTAYGKRDRDALQ